MMVDPTVLLAVPNERDCAPSRGCVCQALGFKKPLFITDKGVVAAGLSCPAALAVAAASSRPQARASERVRVRIICNLT